MHLNVCRYLIIANNRMISEEVLDMTRKLRWGRAIAFVVVVFVMVSVFMIFGASSKKDTLTLATTTSTYDSGLLERDIV